MDTFRSVSRTARVALTLVLCIAMLSLSVLPASAAPKGKSESARIDVEITCDPPLIVVSSVELDDGSDGPSISNIVVVFDGGETRIEAPFRSGEVTVYELDPADYPTITQLFVKAGKNGAKGYGVSKTVNVESACDQDGDGISVDDGDCDDTDPNIYPGAPEIADDGVDQDCDGFDATSSSCLIGSAIVSTVLTQAECDALIDLYNATNGPDWFDNSGWATATDPCSWTRTTCVDGQLKLDLSYNNVVGDLPASIGDLSSLVRLSMVENGVTSVPAELGNLSNLEFLDLSDNQLTSVPAELGELQSLQFLWLVGNELTSIPDEIANLSTLLRLNLSGNDLTSVPDGIADLDGLTHLYLRENQLTSLPDLANLAELTVLMVSSNELTSLPSAIGSLSELTVLWVDDNQLTALPAELGNLSNLDSLFADRNLLTSVPPELGNLSSLTHLRLRNNPLGSVPSELGNLANLEILELSGALLTSIPPELGNLASLETLRLNDNQLTSVPSELGNLSSLFTLTLDSNLLSGDITELMSGLTDTVEFLTLINRRPTVESPITNNCLTVTDAALATWLTSKDFFWDRCV